MLRKILSVITLILVIIVVWSAREQIFEAVNYLSQTNLWVIALLIPEQLLMYYCLGQMFFSYMSAKHQTKKISSWNLARISFELNFVNHAIPSGGFAGLGYISWRLHQFGSSVGQTSFMYGLRYAITITANQVQTIIAVIILLLTGGVTAGSEWVIILTSCLCVSIVGTLLLIVVIASSRKRIDWFAKTSSRLMDWVVRTVTFGRRPHAIPATTVYHYFDGIYKDLIVARRNKKILIRPILWGVVYSFLEVATYWIVGISMGHPELLPQIMVAEAVASVIGAILLTPGGVGGYEGAMIFIMSALGVEVGLATAVVITTRVVVLVGTIVSGYGFYQHAISKLGKAEKAKYMKNEHP